MPKDDLESKIDEINTKLTKLYTHVVGVEGEGGIVQRLEAIHKDLRDHTSEDNKRFQEVSLAISEIKISKASISGKLAIMLIVFSAAISSVLAWALS